MNGLGFRLLEEVLTPWYTKLSGATFGLINPSFYVTMNCHVMEDSIHSFQNEK